MALATQLIEAIISISFSALDDSQSLKSLTSITITIDRLESPIRRLGKALSYSSEDPRSMYLDASDVQSASSKGITYIRRMSQILEILSLSLANKHIRQLRRKIVVIFEEESSKELLKKGKWVRNDTTPPWANLPGRFLATIEDAFKAEVWHNGHRLWGDFSPVPEVVDIAKLIEANEAKR